MTAQRALVASRVGATAAVVADLDGWFSKSVRSIPHTDEQLFIRYRLTNALTLSPP